MGKVTHIGSAVLFTYRNPEEAEGAELAPQVRGEFVGAVDVCGARRDLARGKGVHRFAQHVDIFAEVEGQGRKVDHRFTHPVLKSAIAQPDGRLYLTFT
jgi:hypothetical protein